MGQNIARSSKPPVTIEGKPALPDPLLPLAPPVVTAPATSPRARKSMPDTARRKASLREYQRNWGGVEVPLTLLGSGPKTGWEDLGVVDSLRVLAGLDPINTSRQRNALSTFNIMPAKLQRIFPVKLRPSSVPQYAPPPPRATRQNPRKWSNPHTLTPRMLRRTYRRLWDRLPWVTQSAVTGEWASCSYEAMLDPSRHSVKAGKKAKKVSVSLPVTPQWPQGDHVDKSWL